MADSLLFMLSIRGLIPVGGGVLRGWRERERERPEEVVDTRTQVGEVSYLCKATGKYLGCGEKQRNAQ